MPDVQTGGFLWASWPASIVKVTSFRFRDWKIRGGGPARWLTVRALQPEVQSWESVWQKERANSCRLGGCGCYWGKPSWYQPLASTCAYIPAHTCVCSTYIFFKICLIRKDFYYRKGVCVVCCLFCFWKFHYVFLAGLKSHWIEKVDLTS